MKNRRLRQQALVLGVSVLALAAVWTARERGLGAIPPADGSIASLRAEVRRLQAFSPEHLAQLAKERTAAEDAWRSRTTTLPREWTEAPRDKDNLATRHLRCLDPANLSWGRLVAFVGSLEERNPGKVVSVDVRSKGTRRLRSIASVDITITDRLQAGTVAAAAATIFPTSQRLP